MIIKNNFNTKSTNPLDNYQSIGSTRENNIDNEKKDNKVIEDVINSDNEYDDNEDNNDKWSFFK